ncbi:MAG: hypothetical protein DCC71_06525 [Proteobacteria bacterium]|nr:MAG: hypothetical protein DCC71_06525 [Pseudomonadota bacterium]
MWTWQSLDAAAEPVQPPAGRVRLRGALQAGAGGAVAALLFAAGLRAPAFVVGGVASALLLAALLSPFGVFASIERAFAALGRWVGLALTWLLLPAIFYLFFVPFSRLFRRGRRDAMKRYFDPGAESYWTVRSQRAPHVASTSHERPY